jgi:predicted DNA-binding transcriptional regulator YafY
MSKVTFNTGNFAITVEGEYNADAQAKALENALRYELQRDVATKVYVAVAGEEGKDGKRKLAKDFERDSLEYSEEAAEAFREAAETEMAKRGNFTITVAKYEGSEAASPMKRATAFVDALLDDGDKEAQMRSLFSLQGMENAADADRDALIAFANSKGLGIQPPKAKG